MPPSWFCDKVERIQSSVGRTICECRLRYVILPNEVDTLHASTTANSSVRRNTQWSIEYMHILCLSDIAYIYIYIYIYVCVCVCVCATSVRQWPTNFANFAVSPAAIRSGVYGFSCCYTAVILVLKQTQCDKGVSRIRQSQRRIAICFRQSVSDNTFPQLNYYYSSIMHGCFCLSCATRTLNKL